MKDAGSLRASDELAIDLSKEAATDMSYLQPAAAPNLLNASKVED